MLHASAPAYEQHLGVIRERTPGQPSSLHTNFHVPGIGQGPSFTPENGTNGTHLDHSSLSRIHGLMAAFCSSRMTVDFPVPEMPGQKSGESSVILWSRSGRVSARAAPPLASYTRHSARHKERALLAGVGTPEV